MLPLPQRLFECRQTCGAVTVLRSASDLLGGQGAGRSLSDGAEELHGDGEDGGGVVLRGDLGKGLEIAELHGGRELLDDLRRGDEQASEITHRVLTKLANGNLLQKAYYSSYGVGSIEVIAPGGDYYFQRTDAPYEGGHLRLYSTEDGPGGLQQSDEYIEIAPQPNMASNRPKSPTSN